ncbi:MAG: AI-2E family transporter [Pigmentiphaga sp.]|uniref:AI-2E family transporter n=1 Tax=Pigmentiphaga sp. TaxID=1977564 RepID=UPI0029A816B0|nr:AI-2E family transporter [Pigmentiphaga sp.]MDX3907318.1 AI-2E family transporter [Pigmentiphaga sp.]
MSQTSLQYRTFLFLMILVTVAFGWLLWPFFGAVFWGAILAIIFFPMQRWLLTVFRGRANLAALTTLLTCVLIVIIPVSLIAGAIIREAAGVYDQIRSGNIDFGLYFERIVAAMPETAQNLLARFGLVDISSFQTKLAEVATRGSQFFATQALSIGQNTFQFVISLGVMLYLLFFLLRDGSRLSGRIRQALPLAEEHKRHLFRKFIEVVRATVKGNIVVAITQGVLGGIIFSILGIHGALLWSVVMAFLSLLPAVGAGLIWGPVAIYFIVTGAVLQGIILTLYGILVIGLVDNVLRPILVGKDTRMPDYVVLISTLGGMALFGINGFVIGPLVAALFIAVWDLFSSIDGPPAPN